MTAQTVVLEMFINGAWTPVPLYSGTAATITRGHEPGGGFPSATKIEAELNNDSLAYDPSRPQSALYGVAGRNTRTRIIVNTNTRVYAEASSWRPAKTKEHVSGAGRGRAYVKLTAEGLLRRIGMWSDPLRSPMYRQYSARSTNIGHWSLEDESSAQTLANSSGGLPGTYLGVDLGDSDAPQGAEQAVKIKNGSRMAGTFNPASNTAGWQVFFSVHADALPPAGPLIPVFTFTTSNGLRWEWASNDTQWRLQVTDTDGTVVESTTLLYGSSNPAAEWTFCRVRANQSGGNVAVSMAWYFQDSGVIHFDNSLLFAGNVGAIRSWRQDGNATTDGWSMSHIGGVTTVAEDMFGFVNLEVFNGYQDEPAGTRYLRLMGELGLTAFILGSSTNTAKMGPQKSDTAINLLKEIALTDDARIDDERFDIGLTMRTRVHMYNQAPALTLAFPSQIADFVKVIDDQQTRNRVTVKNRSGGEVTDTLAAGAMSVLPPPAGVGEYKATVDVNLFDDLALPDRAEWELAKGTLEEPRYEEIVVNLLANPALEVPCSLIREGDMIRCTGLEPEAIDLLVVGIVQPVGAVEHEFRFLTEPYTPRTIGTYDGAGRRDAATTTLGVARDAVQTAWTFSSTSQADRWEGAPYLPYNVKVGGEVVTVTAMGAQAGAGPYTQAATVTRSVNGIVKAQTVGTPIRVNTPVRRGL